MASTKSFHLIIGLLILGPWSMSLMAQEGEDLSSETPRARLERYLRSLSPQEREQVIKDLQQKRKSRQLKNDEFLALPTSAPEDEFKVEEIGPPDKEEFRPSIKVPLPKASPTPLEEIQDWQRLPGVDENLYKPRSQNNLWREDLLWRGPKFRYGFGLNYLTHDYVSKTNPENDYEVSGRGAHTGLGVEFPLGKVFSLDLGANMGMALGQADAKTRNDLTSIEGSSFLLTYFDLGFLYTPRGTNSSFGPFVQANYLSDYLQISSTLDNEFKKLKPQKSLTIGPGIKLRIGLYEDYSVQFAFTPHTWSLSLFFESSTGNPTSSSELAPAENFEGKDYK